MISMRPNEAHSLAALVADTHVRTTISCSARLESIVALIPSLDEAPTPEARTRLASSWFPCSPSAHPLQHSLHPSRSLRPFLPSLLPFSLPPSLPLDAQMRSYANLAIRSACAAAAVGRFTAGKVRTEAQPDGEADGSRR